MKNENQTWPKMITVEVQAFPSSLDEIARTVGLDNDSLSLLIGKISKGRLVYLVHANGDVEYIGGRK